MQLNKVIETTCVVALAALAGACGDSESGPNDSQGQTTSNITTIDEGSGVFASQVDATDTEQWIYMDLASQQQVDPGTDPTSSSTWDVAFRRSNVKANGGFSGAGGVEVTVVAGQAFASVTAAPVTTYETDRILESSDPDQPDFISDDNTDFVFGRAHPVSTTGWFAYDSVNHVLSAADVVYIVRARDGAYYKIQFLDYYDQAGASGFPTFRHARINPPDPSTSGFVLDASDRQTPIYFDLETRSVIAVNDPEASTEWDLRILRTSFATNSGESGPGIGGARRAQDATFFSAVSASPVGFDTDARIPPPGPPVPPEQWVPGSVTLGEWFNYDEATRAVSPKDGFFVVRGADGASHYKLKIFSYDDGVYRLDVAPVSRKSDAIALTVEASDPEIWVFVNLRMGTVLNSEDGAGDWDLAFSRTRVQMNSGTSGSGDAGALDLEIEDFDSVIEAPVDGYVPDEMITSGRPGESPFSGNSVLSAWFDYDSNTRSVSPRRTVFSLRLADGSFAKLRFDGYDDGVYSLTYAYAGAVGVSFE